jgi:hypothetical protein
MDLCLLAFEIGMTGEEQDRAEAGQTDTAAAATLTAEPGSHHYHTAQPEHIAARRPLGHWIPVWEAPTPAAAVRFAQLCAALPNLSPAAASRN